MSLYVRILQRYVELGFHEDFLHGLRNPSHTKGGLNFTMTKNTMHARQQAFLCSHTLQQLNSALFVAKLQNLSPPSNNL